jgi:FkbM family methyltransferase
MLSGTRGYSDLRILSGPAKGTKLRLDIRKEGSYWLGNYDQWIFNEFSLDEFIKAGDVVWDCGAYVGYYTAVFRRMVGKSGQIYSFEASSANFKRLKFIPEINNWSNVEVLNIAIGPENTLLKFVNNIGGSNGPYNLSKVYQEKQEELEIEEVHSYGVDELIKELGISEPTFIKFDLESAEEFALHNGNRLFTEIRPVILLELHGEKARDAAGRFFEEYTYSGYDLHHVKTRENAINNMNDLISRPEIPFQLLCIPNKSKK